MEEEALVTFSVKNICNLPVGRNHMREVAANFHTSPECDLTDFSLAFRNRSGEKMPFLDGILSEIGTLMPGDITFVSGKTPFPVGRDGRGSSQHILTLSSFFLNEQVL